ncbi:MAG: hypothetical protein ACKVI5_01615 [Nitrospinaceae bacterium]
MYLGELNGNGVQSYRRLFPRAKYESAESAASTMLKKPSVAQVIKYKLGKEKLMGVQYRSGFQSLGV